MKLFTPCQLILKMNRYINEILSKKDYKFEVLYLENLFLLLYILNVKRRILSTKFANIPTKNGIN